MFPRIWMRISHQLHFFRTWASPWWTQWDDSHWLPKAGGRIAEIAVILQHFTGGKKAVVLCIFSAALDAVVYIFWKRWETQLENGYYKQEYNRHLQEFFSLICFCLDFYSLYSDPSKWQWSKQIYNTLIIFLAGGKYVCSYQLQHHFHN